METNGSIEDKLDDIQKSLQKDRRERENAVLTARLFICFVSLASLLTFDKLYELFPMLPGSVQADAPFYATIAAFVIWALGPLPFNARREE